MSAPTIHSVDDEERVLAIRCELLELERDAATAVATADLLEEWVEALGVDPNATESFTRRFDAFFATMRTEAAVEDEALLRLARRVPTVVASHPVEAPAAPTVEPRFVAPAYVEPVAVSAIAPLVASPPVIEPVPVERLPVETLAVEPVSVEPVSVEVAAVEPVAIEPAAIEPVAIEPVPVKPLPVVDLAVADRAPVEPVVAEVPAVEVSVDAESADEFAALAVELPEVDGAEQSRWAGSGGDGADVDVAFWNEHAPPWWSRRPRLSVSNALQVSAVVAGSVAVVLRLG